MSINSFGPVKQIAYLVDDIELSINEWMDKLGIGPWLVIKNIRLDCTYLGKPSVPEIDIALAYNGDVQIELIKQTNRSPSPYLSFFENKNLGLHHIAYLCDDINSDVNKAITSGLKLVCDIRMPDGSRYVYLDSPVPGDNSFIELIENNDFMKEMFQSGIERASNWAGDKHFDVMDLA